MSMIVGMPPVKAANMTVELLSPAAAFVSADDSKVTYQLNDALDKNNIVFKWNFSNGIDTNLDASKGHISLAEAGSTSIDLTNAEFKYSKVETPVKLRQLELSLKSTALEAGKDYTITLGAAIKANNGDELGKDYIWQFSTAAASVADTVVPVITLKGDAVMNLTVGDTFTEPGFTAIDDVDGDITGAVVVGGDTVDTSTVGTYTITYNVSDATGNEAAKVSRTVVVAEKSVTPYTAQQGIGAFQLMLTSVATGDIEVKEATGTHYSNVIKTEFDPSSAINFDITITGSGGNGYALATAESRVFPYVKILDATKTNVIASYNSATGALKCNETTVAPSGNGTTFKMVLDANSLAGNTQYFLYIDPDLQNKQNPPVKFGKSIYFNFWTAAASSSEPHWASDAALTVSDVTGTGFNLSWPEATGAEAYKVVVSNTTGGETTYALDTAISEGTACTVTGLTANRHYGIKVTATNNVGDSPVSLTTLAVTTPVKTLFTFASGVPDSSNRYGFMPAGTVVSETIFEKSYAFDAAQDPANARFLWYLQAGFNNTNARDHVNSFRLFNLTDNKEVALNYGTTNFGSGTGGWTASGVTESDTGYKLISEMISGDFKVTKIQPSSVWVRFELDIAKYLDPGKEYAITIDPQFHTGGNNPTVLGKVYSFKFITSTPDTQAPTWGSGSAITVNDLTSNGFTVNYPAAVDNMGVAKYNVALKAGNTVITSELTTALSKTFTDLTEGIEYTVTVQAEDAAGNKSAALSTTVNTLRAIPAWGADARLTISNVMATDVTINWPNSNTPEIVAGYALFVNGTETERFRPTDYYCDLGGLISSTKYTLELKPFNKQGEFGEALAAMVVTDGAAVLTFTTTFAVEEIAGEEYYKNYTVKYPIDLANFRLGWNFSNGIDASLGKNLAGLRIYEKETGIEILVDKGSAPYPADADGSLLAGDFRYTKSGGGDQGVGDATKLRLLIFEPTEATLAQFKVGIDYVLEMQPDFISNNNQNTLRKITTFTFRVAPEDNEAPAWPEGALLEADKIGPGSMVIYWPSATDNQTLKEYWLTINEGSPIVMDAQSRLTYKLAGLAPDTLYAIRVVAVDAKNNRSVPLETNIRTLAEDKTKPTWPNGSKLTVKNIATDNADLLWTAADDNVEVTGYRIFNGDLLLAETTECQWHIIHLSPATTYVFRVEAIDQAGNMSSSGPTSVIRTLDGKADTEAPQWSGGSQSTSTTFDLNKTYVTLQWPWATDNVAVKGYKVYLAGELIAIVGDTANTFSATLPLDGKYHTYEIYAFDAAGNISLLPKSFSVLAGRVPDDLIAPSWPTGSEIIISDFTDKTAVISWSAAQDNKGVQSYLLKRDQLWVIWVNQGEDYPGYFQVTDTERKIWYDLDKLYPLNLTYKHPRQSLELVEGEPYSCSLKAYDAAGNSSIGGPKLTFYPGTNPTAGSGIDFVLANMDNSRGTLSSLSGAMNLVDKYTDPEMTSFIFDFTCKLPANYANGITLYNKATNESVDLTSENFVYAENNDSSRLTINPRLLAAETTYVIMFAKDFSSSAGVAVGFDLGWEFTTAKADKEIPTWEAGAALNVAFTVSPTTATLNWPKAIDNLEVTQYQVFKGDELLAVLPGDTTVYQAENLSVATEYNFKVQAGDYLDNWSAWLEKTVTTPGASTTPSGWGSGTLAFTNIHSDNVTLNWSKATGEYAVKEYLIYKNDESEPLAILGSNILTYLAEGLTGKTNYTFGIVARDYSGNISLPLTNSVTTAEDDVNPTWPDNASLNAKDLRSDSFTLYWVAAVDNVKIGQYNIYQDGELIGSTVDGTITEYSVSGLEATTKYTFMVEAVDTNGNKTIENLVFVQSTTVSAPTEGAGIEFTLVSPANENVGKSGNTMLNRVTEPLLETNVAFTFNFAKDLEASTWLSHVVLVKNDNVGNPIEVKAEYFSYSFVNGTGILKLEIPQTIVDMGASYQIKLMSSFAAKDGRTLDKDYIWEFNVAEGLYGIKDIAAGVNSYSAFERAADRFYLMVKSDGTVWGWGNNLYGHLGDGTTQDSAVPVQALNLQNIIKVVAGVNSAFAVDADGGVWGWGSNEHGQLGRGILPTGTSGRYGNETPQKITELPPIVKLVYGFNRCVALDVNGDVWTWGFRTSINQSPYGVLSTGTPVKVPFLSNIKDVAAGWQTSLAVTADGRVMEWAGIDGIPAVVDGLTEVKSVACDSFNYTKNNLALKKDGTLWYWGEGTIVVTIPGPSNKLVVDLMQVKGAEDVKEIYTKSMAILTNDRSVRSVNVDFVSKNAVLGDVISNLTDISKLAVYTTSSRTNPVSGGLALTLDGTLLQFIADEVVPIDPGMDTVEQPVWPDESAVTFSNLTEQGLTLNWNSCGADISAYAVYQNGSLIKTLPGSSLLHSITGLKKGTEYTFKVEARLAGSSYTTNGPSAAVTLSDWNPTMQGAGKIAAGTGHSLLIDAAGNVWAWGANDFGQLGIGSNEDQTAPCQIDTLSGIEAVAVGEKHSLALDGDGNVWVWGRNDKYQLGLGTSKNSSTPVKLTTISDVKVISAAGNYSLAVKRDGTLWSWGEACNANLNYAVSGIDGKTPGRMKYGTPSPSINYHYENVKSAAASRNYYAVIFADGTISRSGYFVDSVGAKTYWTMLSNPGLMGVQAISAGDDFLMALLEDGTVAVLGDNSQGQFGNGTRINLTPATAANYKKVSGLDNVVAISAGATHGLALKANGSVWGWGQNDKGQLGIGNTVTQLVPAQAYGMSEIRAIGAGALHSIILKSDATANIEAYAFGSNDKGQLGTGNAVSSIAAKRILYAGYIDTTAPVFPAWFAIYVNWLSEDSANLLWTEAVDNIGVTAYEIWQNNVKVGEVLADKQTFSITGLIPGQTYEFGIKAKDGAGNVSDLSKTVAEVTVNANNKNLAVTDTTQAATITVPKSINDATINVAGLLNVPSDENVETNVLPALTITVDTSISTTPVKMEIPGGTTIKAPAAWDGTINVPTVQANNTVIVTPDQGKTATVKAVIEVGYGDTPLIFSKAIKLVLPGQAGKDVGYYQSGVFTKITNACQENSQAWADANLPEGGDGRIDVNGDLVIWTKHFTRYVVYEQSSSGGGSSSGGNTSGDGSGIGADTGTPGGLTVSFTAVRTTPGDTLLHFDFSNGMDKNLDDSLKLIRVFEKATGKNVSYSSYKYDKEGNKDTGDKVRRIELNFDNLKAGTKYGVELGAALKANNGSTLGIKKSFEFTTSATAAGGSKPVEQGIDSSGGKISGNGVTVDIPAAALDSKVKVLIELLADKSKLPLAEKSKLIGDVAEITIDKTTNFKKPVIVTLKFDKSKVDLQKQDIAICYLDEKAGKWIALNNVKVDLSAGTVSGEVSHFTKFAVIATEKADISQPISELSDIKGHWSENAIAVLVKSGAIGGYPDGTFKPDQGISRAEFVTILVKALQLSAQNGKVFDDTANHWARQFIATAAANGVVSGYSETAFGPDDLITREQMTVMIVKAAGLKAGASKPASFTDGDQISPWAAEAVSVSASQGIVNGYPDTTFRPRGTATRAEAVTVIAQTQKIAI